MNLKIKMSFFGFGQSADIQIILNNEDKLRTTKVKLEDGRIEKRFLFYDGEPIEGEVVVKLKKANQKLEHYGIKIEFIGLIETFYDRNNQNEFISLKRDLATAGEILQQNTRFNFSFLNVEKPYESYIGNNVKLRYFLRVTIVKKFSDIVKELDIAVHTLSTYPERNTNIKMEVGIEDCLHIEFEYNNSRYHLKDVIVGKIYFLLVRIKIKYMEIAIVKQEVVGNGASTFRENETLAKYEIMDGSPVKGESIPIRLFLNGYDLTPTLKDVGKKFSVKYFLNLVLVDEEDRRYYKQHEITLWRKVDEELRKKNFTQNGGERITDSNPPIMETNSNDIKNNDDEILDDDEEDDSENPTSTL
ncbi:Vacuolar protein sorting-associated protein 26B [Strongyloides ratti]|uniref:Vacuolar protein sorting-associated protein 26B n=1 Tax=Strongyloides ratti TaxID=34506 RepID=A0A090LN84_STRRB|nr:Vacuolar protein sorting-associated protein 26B [Strongyloides ratti]CEF69634.1 Vacuolar protein sorting-associated protein 26B [Strongyloides ratti]